MIMERILTRATILVAFFSSASAEAQTWTSYVNAPHMSVHIDLSSVSRVGDLVRYWDRILFREPQRSVDGTMDELSTFKEANCRTMSYRNLQISARLDGRPVPTSAPDGSLRRMEPGSAGSLGLNIACGRRTPPSRRVAAAVHHLRTWTGLTG